MSLNLINRIKRKMVDYGLYSISKGQLCIATYHGISIESKNKFNGRFISLRSLESHLKFYKKYFHSVSIEDIFNGNFRKDKLNVHLTFDDGYLNNYKYAYPLLEKYQQYSTFYITGVHNTENKILWADLLEISPYYLNDLLEIDSKQYYKRGNKFPELAQAIKADDKGGFYFKSKVENEIFRKLTCDFRKDRNLDDYWQLMNNEHIFEVSRSKYVEIGSHGYYHNNLGVLPLNLAIEEILRSKYFLEEVIQKKVRCIAYPDGSYNNDLLKLVEDNGFNIQFLYGAIDNAYKNLKGVYDREGVYSNASSENEIFYKLINGRTNRKI